MYDKFNPVIVKALDEIGANELWRNATNAYNKIPLVTKVNNDLDDHVTTKGWTGFLAKMREEKNIRTIRTKNSRNRTTRKKCLRQDGQNEGLNIE